jgi:predicted FMN-binding regulatory protein PaiB
VLLDTVRAFESTRDGWIYDGGEQYLQAMSSGIVAFQLHVRGIEGVRKLSQNRDREERSAIAARLAESGSSAERAIAQLIEEELRAQSDGHP